MPGSMLNKMGRGMCVTVMCKGVCQFANLNRHNQVASVVSLQRLYLNFTRQP